MTVTAVALSPAVQELIDCRLDTLDRILLGRAPRADRLAIVQEVEAQVHHMLREGGADDPTREDVLAVLARLDPPEAYLTPRADPDPWAAHAARVMALQPGPPRPNRRLARLGGILGVIALAAPFLLFPLSWLLAAVTNSEALFYLGLGGTCLLALPAAIVAIVLGALARRAGGWAVAGLVCGIIAIALLVLLIIGVTLLLL